MSIIKAADQYVGVPYVIHGRDSAGWDCWGCVATLRRVLFDKPTPSWAEAYNAVDFKKVEKIESLIRERMEGWSKCEIKPGAVLLFRTLGAECHVGLYLEQGQFIHAMGGCQTVIVPLESWKGRFVAAYDTE